MTASEGSLLGFAPQTAKGTANTTNASFTYMLVTEGAAGPGNMQIPLDREVGGGALLRDIVKVGVSASKTFGFIPRPVSLGWMLFGLLGEAAAPATKNVYLLQDYAMPDSGSTNVTSFTDADGNTVAPTAAVAIKAVCSGTQVDDLVITGTDANGDPQSENLTLNSDTVVTSANTYLTVTQLTVPEEDTSENTISVYFDSGVDTHVFTHATDQFSVPYFTGRFAPGNMWGEQYQDMRFTGLSLDFAAANYVRGTVSMLGRIPSRTADTNWSAASYLDSGSPFITPTGYIELPTGTTAKVLGGTFAAGLEIPLDQQYIVGSYYPEDLDVTQRVYALSLNVKVTDNILYDKLMFDPAGGSAWAAELLKEGDLRLLFKSVGLAGNGQKSELSIAANGSNQASGNGNVVWTVDPIAVMPSRQITMNVTGTFLADPLAGDPITVSLVNNKATQYAVS